MRRIVGHGDITFCQIVIILEFGYIRKIVLFFVHLYNRYFLSIIKVDKPVQKGSIPYRVRDTFGVAITKLFSVTFERNPLL